MTLEDALGELEGATIDFWEAPGAKMAERKTKLLNARAAVIKSIPYARVRELLLETRLRPCMFARSREALIMRVTTLIEMCSDDFVARDFYMKYFTPAAQLDMLVVDDEWAINVVDEAIKCLHELEADQ